MGTLVMEPGARTEEGVTGRVIQATRAILGVTRNKLRFCFKDAGAVSFPSSSLLISNPALRD